MTVRLAFRTPPALAPAYLRGLLDRRPRRLPEGVHPPVIEGGAEAAVADLAALERYREVCGLPDDGLLPIAYPHVLVGGLHIAMLQSPAFPVRLPGLVHLSNDIEVIEAVLATSTLSFHCRLDESKATRRGAEFSLRTEARVAGRPAWRETMTFLSPAPRRGPRPPREEAAGLPPVVGEWDVPADTGRRYARVSGDFNPIHLSALSAKPFGFRAAIAHGMWSLARCQAWLGGPAAAGARLEVAFLRPLFLPARVALHADRGATDTRFWLAPAGGGRPYLSGAWRPAGACGGAVGSLDGARDAAGPAGLS